MDYPSSENITRQVLASFAGTDSPRLREIFEKLVTHLHAFVRDADLTREECFAAVDLLRWAGEVSDGRRNEFMGFSDTLGVTALVEFLSPPSGATTMNMLGPFYVADAPELDFNADLKGDEGGAPVLLRGRVLDEDGRPIAGARINLWQTREDGLYDVQVEGLDEYRFRGWMTTRDDGAFQVRTIEPAGYTAPMDGPLGQMLIAANRNIWRPAHWHFEIVAAGHTSLVTELYPRGTAHLEDDVAFGPRADLVVDIETVTDPAEAAANGMPSPFRRVAFDFRLAAAPGSAEARRPIEAGAGR